MDSELLQDFGDLNTTRMDLKINANLNDAQPEPSVTSADSPHRTSSNSRIGLLQNNSTSAAQEFAHSAFSDHPVRLTSLNASTMPQQVLPTPMDSIKKTRVRNKDPYAIDLDDDDEEYDFLASLPRTKQREGESLIDFLRNSEPPVENNPTPAPNGQPARPVASSRRSSAVIGLRSFGGDALSIGRRASTQSHDASQLSRTSSSATRSNGVQSSIHARDRDADYTGPGGTRDLANFFRSSTPPSASRPAPAAKSIAASLRSNSKVSVAQSKSSMTGSMKKSRMGFLGGGMGSLFGRGSPRKVH